MSTEKTPTGQIGDALYSLLEIIGTLAEEATRSGAVNGKRLDDAFAVIEKRLLTTKGDNFIGSLMVDYVRARVQDGTNEPR